jgi:DNA primase
MNVFQAVKQSVTTRQAAQSYGISVNRRGMAVCPFHNDKNPSMKVDNRFHCFACQADGDVIDFASALFNMSAVDAALKLAQDFGISYEYERGSPRRLTPDKPIKPKKTPEQEFNEKIDYSFRVLSDYLHLLKEWKIKYAPESEVAEWHPLFCEALENITRVEDMLDTLLSGDVTDRAFFITDYGKRVPEIEKRIREFNAGAEDGGRERCA